MAYNAGLIKPSVGRPSAARCELMSVIRPEINGAESDVPT